MINTSELTFKCPICGSPHLEIADIEVEPVYHAEFISKMDNGRQNATDSTIDFYCKSCKTSISKVFRNACLDGKNPYGFFQRDVERHMEDYEIDIETMTGQKTLNFLNIAYEGLTEQLVRCSEFPGASDFKIEMRQQIVDELVHLEEAIMSIEDRIKENDRLNGY